MFAVMDWYVARLDPSPAMADRGVELIICCISSIRTEVRGCVDRSSSKKFLSPGSCPTDRAYSLKTLSRFR